MHCHCRLVLVASISGAQYKTVAMDHVGSGMSDHTVYVLIQ